MRNQPPCGCVPPCGSAPQRGLRGCRCAAVLRPQAVVGHGEAVDRDFRRVGVGGSRGARSQQLDASAPRVAAITLVSKPMKETGRRPEGDRKETGRKPEGDRKETGRRPEGNRKLPPSAPARLAHSNHRSARWLAGRISFRPRPLGAQQAAHAGARGWGAARCGRQLDVGGSLPRAKSGCMPRPLVGMRQRCGGSTNASCSGRIAWGVRRRV